MHHIAYSESLRRSHHDAAEAARGLDPEVRSALRLRGRRSRRDTRN